MQIARVPMVCPARRGWLASLAALGLWLTMHGSALAQTAPDPESPPAAEPLPTQRPPESPWGPALPPPPAVPDGDVYPGSHDSPSMGSPLFATAVSGTVGSFFSRLLVSGSWVAQGGAMLSPRLGLIVQSRVEVGGLDLRYLLVSSGRLGGGVQGLVSERFTLSAVVSAGLLGFRRNSNGIGAATPVVAVDVSGDVELYSRRHLAPSTDPGYRPRSRIYVPIGVSVLVLPWVHDGSSLAAAANVGLGYRYR